SSPDRHVTIPREGADPGEPRAERASVASGEGQWRRSLAWWAPWVASGFCAVLLGAFWMRFNPDLNDRLINLAWLAAVAIWVGPFMLVDPPYRGVRVHTREAAVAALLLLAFSVAWLPFYNDWRWVSSGDSFVWYIAPSDAVRFGLHRSLLSIHGIFDQFTVTQAMVGNGLMFVFGPTFFWHRASKLVASVLSLAAIYTYFSLVLRPPWALAIMVATATHFIWLVFSFLSYNHIDSFIFAYGALTLMTLLIRQSERDIWWVLLGTVAGASLFFTQTAWAEVTACGILAALWALRTRRFRALILCGVSFVVAGFPILVQLRELIRQAVSYHSGPAWDLHYLEKISGLTLSLPYGTGLDSVGIYDKFFFRPCGELYFAGLFIAAVSLVPAVRRRLHLPPAAAALLLLFLSDLPLLSITH